jgi:hypothetical protein
MSVLGWHPRGLKMERIIVIGLSVTLLISLNDGLNESRRSPWNPIRKLKNLKFKSKNEQSTPQVQQKEEYANEQPSPWYDFPDVYYPQMQVNEYVQYGQEDPQKDKKKKKPSKFETQYNDDTNLEPSIEYFEDKPCNKRKGKGFVGAFGNLLPELLIGGFYLVSGLLCVISGGCTVSTVTVLSTTSTTLSGTLTTVAFVTSTSSTSTSYSSTSITYSYTTTSTTSFATLFSTVTATTTSTSKKPPGRKKREIEVNEDWVNSKFLAVLSPIHSK